MPQSCTDALGTVRMMSQSVAVNVDVDVYE